MKRKFSSMWRVVIAAAMVISLGLVIAVPAGATDIGDSTAPADTVGRGEINVLVMDFTIQDGGDIRVAGAEPTPGTASADGEDADWSIESYDKTDGGAWDSDNDLLAIDDDADTVYTAQADTTLAGTAPAAGTALTTTNPWTTAARIAFVDGGTANLWETANDLILQDDDKDGKYTAQADTTLAGVAPSAGTSLLTAAIAAWQGVTTAGTVSVYDKTDGDAWDAANDTIWVEGGVADDVYVAVDDTLLAGTAPTDATAETGDGGKDADWTTINLYDASGADAWNAAVDGIIEDFHAGGTYSAAADSTLAGTGTAPGDGTTLVTTNPFTTAPQVAFNDAATAGTYESGSDVIVTDPHNGGTYSAAADTYVAGALPADATPYTDLNIFDTDWGMDSIDATGGDPWDSNVDAIIIDADTNDAYRDELNAITLQNTGSATDTQDIAAVKVWAENDLAADFQADGANVDDYLGSATWDGSDSWDLSGLTLSIPSTDQRVYVTVDIDEGPGRYDTITMKVPVLADAGITDAYDSGDEGLFFASTDDTGDITNEYTQTIWFPVRRRPPPPPPGVTDVSDVVTDEGVFTETTTAASEDGNVVLTIDEDTIGLTVEGESLAEVSITEMEEPPAPPEDSNVIGLTYDLGPDGAVFVPPIELSFTYDPLLIPEGVSEENLVIAMWDGEKWVNLECVVDPETNTITARIGHFTAFTVLAYTHPAAFVASELSISPTLVDIEEEVTISVLVTNIGDLTGSYEVTLRINDVAVATKDITLAGYASQRVTFTTAKDVAGTYSVAVDEQTGTFEVKIPPVPVPAAFTTSALSITPIEVDIGEEVTISVLVTNIGDLEGTYTVTLRINDVAVATKDITLAGHASQRVTFTTTKDVAGTYSVAVDEQTGTFEVKIPPPRVNWAIWGPIIAVGVFLAIFLPIRRRRRA